MIKSETPAVVEGYDQGMGSAAGWCNRPFVNCTALWQIPQ